MPRYQINHDRENCIGCGACAAVCEKFWVMDEDGKSNVIGGRRNADGSETFEELGEDDFPGNMEAAEACPVNVIHIIDKETKKKIL